jgi:N utilization substance protein A
LLRLFEQEIPEVYEGLVEIKAIAREPGWRSKVAVYSKDDRVDAVGACVGMKGARVMAIVKELSGERIDIVPWDNDVNTFVARALSPAQVSSIRVADWEGRALHVIVAEDQLSLAIGKEGQNVRLAAKLTGWKIDLVTTEILRLRELADEQVRMDVGELDGVTPRLAGILNEAGLETVKDIVAAGLEGLMALEGVGPKTAEKILGNAEAAHAELTEAREEFIETERRRLEEERQQAEPVELFNQELLEAEDDDEGEAEDAEETAAPAEAALFGAFDEMTADADNDGESEDEAEAQGEDADRDEDSQEPDADGDVEEETDASVGEEAVVESEDEGGREN